jgi:hypothetical protein
MISGVPPMSRRVQALGKLLPIPVAHDLLRPRINSSTAGSSPSSPVNFETTAQNVKAGTVVAFTLPAGALFLTDCNRHLVLPRSAAAMTVFYEASPHKRMVVGSTTARRPEGAHVAR